jgi:hypothetical protein
VENDLYYISSFCSVGLFDVEENGVQYMLLCRAILGNMGSIKPGSHEFPSNDLYDSVAGNHSNLGCYLIWNSNLSTYMCLEYLISFRLSANVQGNRFSKIFLSLNCDLVYSHRNRAE